MLRIKIDYYLAYKALQSSVFLNFLYPSLDWETILNIVANNFYVNSIAKPFKIRWILDT